MVFVGSESLHLCKNADVAGMKIVRMIHVCTAVLISACSSEPTQIIDRGHTVFTEYCVRCHGADGEGTEGVPSINTSVLMRQEADSLINVLTFGKESRYAQGTHRAMPPIPYNAKDIAAAATYLRQRFGARTDTVTVSDVERVQRAFRAQLSARLRPLQEIGDSVQP